METAETPVVPASEDLDKSDAQRLAEAWDVELEKLAHLTNAADLRDVSKAKLMNQALWPATMGYFLDELLETDAAANDRVRRFFTADVVARGSLPAIRVGKQPYGVLVTSAFDRWQIDERVDDPSGPPVMRTAGGPRRCSIDARVQLGVPPLLGQPVHGYGGNVSFGGRVGNSPTDVFRSKNFGSPLGSLPWR